MNKQKSFTLIELLVVIVIIGILAGVIMISTSSSIDKANIAKLKVFSESIKNNLTLNLVSEWDFENALNLGLDIWGGNDGISNGTVISKSENECVFGKCIELGENDNIEVTTLNNLSGVAPYTLEAWINPSTVWGNLGILNYNPYFILVIYDARIVYVDKKFITRVNSPTILIANKWQHIIATTDGSTIQDQKIYINGNLTIGHYEWGYGGPSVQHLFIGGKGYDAGQFYNGKIDNIKVYNSALSSSQIKQKYIAGLDSLLSNGSVSKEDYNQRINALAYEE